MVITKQRGQALAQPEPHHTRRHDGLKVFPQHGIEADQQLPFSQAGEVWRTARGRCPGLRRTTECPAQAGPGSPRAAPRAGCSTTAVSPAAYAH
ncbi:hypothetical protein WR25_16018 [Diploscapter pachys]|uniref:Uncharacterized protein n=1 Tax=Diploscapter pachys TaxID=2018661 RepID=A0A2A2KCE4_9BILA|nr:hypothetical protein WR25_16018 [Diploscapter pachys]